MTYYDIIVVGAGPAGAVFAANVPKRYSVLLIDAHNIKYKGRGKPCGGLISPDAQKLLRKYGYEIPAEILAEPQIPFVKTFDADSGITLDCKRNYINVNREKFDGWLRSTVKDNVVTTDAVCTDAVRTNGGFSVKVKLQNGDTAEYSSRLIIGGDGADSIVRKKLFPDKKARKYTAVQQWFEADDVSPFYSCVFDSHSTDRCMWSFFKNGKMVFGGAFPSERCGKRFEDAKATLEKNGYSFGEPVLTEACETVCPRPGDFFCGKDGALLIGEAAGFISASSFEGISYAIQSGKLLADAFEKGGNVEKTYIRSAWKIKAKLYIKIIKAAVMYDPFLRKIAMKLGLGK